jgi:hypothetical protein
MTSEKRLVRKRIGVVFRRNIQKALTEVQLTLEQTLLVLCLTYYKRSRAKATGTGMYKDKTVLKQNRQPTYNITSWHSRAVIIAMETQQYVPFLLLL